MHLVVSTVQLSGVTLRHFDSSTISGKAAREGFRQSVAKGSGTICGTMGTSSCSKDDVTIVSITGARRQGVSIRFQLQTYSASAASASVTALSSYLKAPAFKTALQSQGGALANINEVVLTATPTKTTSLENSHIGYSSGTGVSVSSALALAATQYMLPLMSVVLLLRHI